MKSVDLADPSDPELVGILNTNAWDPVDLLVAGSTAHIGHGSGVVAVTIENPSTPPVLGYLDLEDIGEFLPIDVSLYARALRAVGDVLYLGVDENFAILDVADPASPQFVGYTQLPYNVYDILIDGSTAYLACSRYGVQIVDISQPTSPAVTDAVYAPGDVTALSLAGDLLYAACDEAGLTIIDVSTPGDASILSWVNTGGYVRDVEVVGDLAFLISGDIGLMIYDVADPGAPVFRGVTGIPDSVRDLIVQGDYAYVSSSGEVWVVDITDPAYPEPVVAFGDFGATAMSLHGDILYVAGWPGSTAVYDVTDPLNASFVGMTATAGGGGDYQNVAYGDGVLFQAGYDGLAIVLPQCVANPGAFTDLPERVYLSQNYPNPFNPRTTIQYELAAEQPVTLCVYDLAGRLVQTLISGETKSAGPHEAVWLGKDEVGRSAAAGVYLYELVTPDVREVRRMTLLK